MKEETKNRRVLDKVISIILIVFIVASTFTAILFSYYRSQNKMITVFGYSVCYILTASMEPTLNVGDVILIKDTDPTEIQIGDIITYKSDYGSLAGSYITHRVTQITDNEGVLWFTTKGDANSVEDVEIITVAKIEGVYVREMPIIKFLASMLSNTLLFVTIIIIPLLIAMAIQIADFVKTAKSKEE
ncbi:MAG: signal peptidase I [Spirochaetales bacterium]